MIHGKKPEDFTLRLFGVLDGDVDFYFEIDGLYFVRKVSGELQRVTKKEYDRNRLRIVK